MLHIMNTEAEEFTLFISFSLSQYLAKSLETAHDFRGDPLFSCHSSDHHGQEFIKSSNGCLTLFVNILFSCPCLRHSVTVDRFGP